MKIGVLTHPLRGNYGGMLQAYALVKTLRRLGHEAANIDYMPNNTPSFWKNPISYLRSILCIKSRIIGFALKHNLISSLNKTPNGTLVVMAKNFQKKHVPSVSIRVNPEIQFIEKNIEAVVVGSDQVWRKQYAHFFRRLSFFFLDFVSTEVRRRSISYAASFGSDTWEGNEQETSICQSHLKDFKAVSVREHSGVNICRDIFGKDAIQVIDPTMLLEVADYNNLIAQEKTWIPKKPFIATYVLDETPHITSALTHLESHSYIQPLSINPQTVRKKVKLPISVPQWLRLIRDCEYFITDSFHGCVFAIIFNIPFVCIGNHSRGSARFDSLLQTFGLENRMTTIENTDAIISILKSPIDWQNVNDIRNREKQRAFDFLNQHLL